MVTKMLTDFEKVKKIIESVDYLNIDFTIAVQQLSVLDKCILLFEDKWGNNKEYKELYKTMVSSIYKEYTKYRNFVNKNNTNKSK